MKYTRMHGADSAVGLSLDEGELTSFGIVFLINSTGQIYGETTFWECPLIQLILYKHDKGSPGIPRDRLLRYQE